MLLGVRQEIVHVNGFHLGEGRMLREFLAKVAQ